MSASRIRTDLRSRSAAGSLGRVLWIAVAAPLACGGDPGGPSAAPPADFVPDPAVAPVSLSGAWTRSTPEAEGFDPGALERAIVEAPSAVPNIRSVVVVRNGRLVREAYFGPARADSAHDRRSVTKTVTALLVGIASDRGLLHVDDLMTDWIEHPALRTEHDGIRILHLLDMTSGMRWSDAADFTPWVQSGRPVGYVLERDVVAPPGQVFMYNTGGSHLLAVIVERAAGEPLFSFAERYLFGPLGITNLYWPAMQDGVPVGGAALALLSTDAAKIGQLILQRGRSGDAPVVSEAWIAGLTETRLSFGDVSGVLSEGGYGFQLWTDASGAPGGAHAYVLWGYGGQFVWVVPDRNLVVVTAAHWRGVNDSAQQQARPIAQKILRPILASARPVGR